LKEILWQLSLAQHHTPNTGMIKQSHGRATAYGALKKLHFSRGKWACLVAYDNAMNIMRNSPADITYKIWQQHLPNLSLLTVRNNQNISAPFNENSINI